MGDNILFIVGMVAFLAIGALVFNILFTDNINK